MRIHQAVAIAFTGVLCALSAAPALAQTCAAPIAPMANTTYAFDTCTGDINLQLVCGIFALSGPATVFDLNLPYPAGTVTMQSMNVNFVPDAYLIRMPCNGMSPCYAATDATIDLSTLDSGHYLLVVTASQVSQSTCGQAMVTFNLTTEQQAGMLEGVFRSGGTPIWEP